jgi:hypothetical protein
LWIAPEETPVLRLEIIPKADHNKMKRNLLALICIAVLCTILTLGLWPFHSPRNEVAWLQNRNGLRFGRCGNVISSGPLQITSPRNTPEASLEIWLQPRRIWDSGTLLAFYKPADLSPFSLHQSLADLLIRTETQDEQHHSRAASLYVNDAFRRKAGPAFITVTSGVKGAWIYIDGVLAVAAPQFPLSARDFMGRLVLGDSPRQPDNWSGLLLGLAIYDRQLAAAQVLHSYATWEQTGRPEIAENEGNIALYLFDERTGDIVHDEARSGVDLYIPERCLVLDKIVLEPFWTEFATSHDYWGSVLKNIVGFVPFGFCFYAYLVTILPIKRAALVTVALGTAVSFTIEILQAFLPTRESGTTDLITNTLGTWVGVASYNFLIPTLARFFPWLPFPVPPRK